MGGTLIGVGVTVSRGDGIGVDVVVTPPLVRKWLEVFEVCAAVRCVAGDEVNR